MEKRLLGNPFWNKKLDRELKVRDTDKNGKITLNDYDLILERYSKYSGVSKEKVEACRRFMMRHCATMGLTDASKSLTYNQAKKGVAKAADDPSKDEFYLGMFHMLDVDKNDKITLDEWETHYKCLRIGPTHAKASFKAMDLNDSNTVTRDEFVAYHCEFYFSAENKLNSGILFGPLD